MIILPSKGLMLKVVFRENYAQSIMQNGFEQLDDFESERTPVELIHGL